MSSKNQIKISKIKDNNSKMASFSQLIQDAYSILHSNEKLYRKIDVLEKQHITHRKTIRRLNSEIAKRDEKIESLTFDNDGLHDRIKDLEVLLLSKDDSEDLESLTSENKELLKRSEYLEAMLLAKTERLEDVYDSISKIKSLISGQTSKDDVKSYQIIDNGYPAYRADVNYSNSSVVVGSLEDTEKHTTDTVLTIPKFMRCWVGNNRPRTSNAITNLKINVYYDGLGELNDGNCLLFQVSENGYILVTQDITYFETEDTIIDFFSAITNSDMVIPIIVCENSVLCSYWDMLSFPKNERTFDPLFHSYDNCCREASKVKHCNIVGRLFESTKTKNYIKTVAWNEGLFTSALYQNFQLQATPGLFLDIE
jgi:hypothetical protein